MPPFFEKLAYVYPLLSSTKSPLSYFLGYLLLSACVVLFADLSSMLLNRDFGLGEFLGGS